MHALDLSRKAETTYPREKVYGLMGLTPLVVAEMVQPDYKLTLCEVYISFAQAWITATCSLELLEQCTSPNKCLPLWSQIRTTQITSVYTVDDPPITRPPMTSHDLPVSRFNPSKTVLSVKGMSI